MNFPRINNDREKCAHASLNAYLLVFIVGECAILEDKVPLHKDD